ncbi:uncharacterized protein PRCAT00001919001 [Priceomyces carsonii]|uniref:uncharacterized protein n=1 Tax=Priceomyces carsonii TaxID=28549 RepID=UPI002ED9C7A5|nr:unnamed protein product [Priceomyces carsonii]
MKNLDISNSYFKLHLLNIMSYRGRGRGGFQSNFNNRNPSQQNVDSFLSANSVPVEILGWNGASPDDCINFISRKCKIVVRNFSVDPGSGILKGYVKSSNDADELCKWSGVKFAGQSLRITKVADANSIGSTLGSTNTNSNNTIEVITGFLRSRYQPEIRMLNLAAVKQDPSLVSKGFFASLSTTSKFFPALMKVAKELKLSLTSVDLSGNELTDLSMISSLAYTFPMLENLSLLNNNLSRLKSFETWKHKLNFLRELIITENPILNLHNPNDLVNLKTELMRIFPRLIVLNGEIIRNEQVLMTNLTFPFEPSQGMFFQDDEIQNISTNFVANYYKLWDNNRQELLILYQNESQFSMQVDSAHPHSLESNTNQFNNSTDFGYYLPQSRNLSRVSSTKSRMSRVAKGQSEIYELFKLLPKSRHELVSKPTLFCMESFRFPQLDGIMITLHGTFEETAAPENVDMNNTNPSGPRGRFTHHKNKKIPLSNKSFDRTFIIIPGQNGSMIIASDLLLVRPDVGSQDWNSQNSATPHASRENLSPAASISPQPQPQPTPSAEDLPPEVKANLNPMQQDILVKVLLETKLTLQYGIILGEQSNWDYQQCIINFKNSVAALPRDAYVS